MNADMIVSTLISAVISGVISIFVLGYLQHWFNGKLREVDANKQERDNVRKQKTIIEQKRKQAEGRLLFWLHHSIVTKETSTADLDNAMKAYNDVEEQERQLNNEILSSYEHKK